MYAAMFRLALDGECASRERCRHGRALATALTRFQGFVAFLALEADDGSVGGLCICMDVDTLDAAHQFAKTWQVEHHDVTRDALPAYVTGKVIVQHGF